jgi:hypothetical protein
VTRGRRPTVLITWVIDWGSRAYVAILGLPVPDGSLVHYPDVPGLFARIRSELAEGHLGSVFYDALTGYPTRIVIDYDGPDVNGADGEIKYTVSLEIR